MRVPAFGTVSATPKTYFGNTHPDEKTSLLGAGLARLGQDILVLQGAKHPPLTEDEKNALLAREEETKLNNAIIQQATQIALGQPVFVSELLASVIGHPPSGKEGSLAEQFNLTPAELADHLDDTILLIKLLEIALRSFHEQGVIPDATENLTQADVRERVSQALADLSARKGEAQAIRGAL